MTPIAGIFGAAIREGPPRAQSQLEGQCWQGGTRGGSIVAASIPQGAGAGPQQGLHLVRRPTLALGPDTRQAGGTLEGAPGQLQCHVLCCWHQGWSPAALTPYVVLPTHRAYPPHNSVLAELPFCECRPHSVLSNSTEGVPLNKQEPVKVTPTYGLFAA